MLKFSTGTDVLTHLTQKTSTAGDELGGLVRQLAVAAEPVENDFLGAGRAVFDNFHRDVDGIAIELSAALSSVLTGIDGQNRAIQEGVQQMTDETRSDHSGSSFESARFGVGR